MRVLPRQCLLLLMAIPVTIACQDAAGADARPNVVVIVADDMGRQLGCYGDKTIRTPHMDRLAESGVRFTRAYCTTASCSASRSVILSGLYNHANGQYGLAHRDHHFSVYDMVRSLPMMLAEAGYRTANFGKHHVSPEYAFHFEESQPENSRNPVDMANRAKTWIAADADRPFFLYFCPTDPHRGKFEQGDNFANLPDNPEPYPGIERVEYDPKKIDLPPWLPDRPEVRRDWAQYCQAVSRFDAGVGRLLDVIDETGHADDTLVMVLSDNGPPFPGAKTTLYEPGINLPLIVRNPRHESPGTTCDALVTWADLTPTVLDYCNLAEQLAPPVVPKPNSGSLETKKSKQPYKFQGRSFLPAMQAKRADGWDETYYSHTFHEATNYYPMRAIRSGRYKLIVNFAHPLPFPFASDLYNSPTWQAVVASKDPAEMYGPRTVTAYQQRLKFELYDLEADPWEAKNLAADDDHAEVVEKLTAKIRAWQEATRDPWLHKWEYE